MPPLAHAQVRPTDSVVEVVRRYERHGFPSRFAVRPGGNVRCTACQREHPARWVQMLAVHLLDARSVPQRDIAVAAVECPACEERGTLALTLGSAAPIEDKLVAMLLDDRREGGAEPVGLRVGQ